MSKTLVAYFSCSGITEEAAKRLAAAAKADLYKIEPKTPYTDADLDWNDRNSRSSIEMRDFSFRPEIVGGVHNMASYDTVFVGFPIWWYVAPNIIKTFLESYDFTGKTLISFATSGSTGIEKADAVLQAFCKSPKWKSGKLLNTMTDADLADWVKELGLL